MNLFIFDKLTNDPVIRTLLNFKNNPNTEDYYFIARSFIAYSKKRLTCKDIIREYTIRVMLEQDSLQDISRLRNFLRQDVKTIYSEIFETDWDALFRKDGYIPMSDIEILPEKTLPDGYTVSVSSMIDCESNEALGGALLAHAESFAEDS